MKNNKGFTLVEVLAVIAILVTIIVIVTPKVFKQFKTAEDVTDKEQINTLINTAKLYMNQNSNLLPQENDIYVIQMQELKDSGLIKTNQILNPSTKEELNGCIIVKYENNKYKYEYKQNNCDKQVVVTFDPQGGTVDKTTKVVTTTETYGELPTPTREGYTFMGWNGKNMFDMETWLNQCKSAYGGTFIKDNKSITLTSTTSNAYTITYYVTRVRYGDINSLKTPVNPNSNYTLSWEKSFDEQGRVFIFINDKDSKDGPLYQFSTNNLATKRTISTTADAEYIRVRIDVDAGSSVTFSNFQLEEGDTATPYEPYYITSDTTVVQENNHTLKAIWKANE